jgi:predicted metal-dependent hydrolase
MTFEKRPSSRGQPVGPSQKPAAYQGICVPMPPHAYVPGRSARHPKHWFDEIKASVTPDIPAQELHETMAFIAGRAYFDAGFYWECHEVLDPVWMQTQEPSPERDVVLALIQLANARLKMRLGQPRAAWRLCDMAETHLSRCPRDRNILGVHVSEMLSEVISTRRAAKHFIK